VSDSVVMTTQWRKVQAIGIARAMSLLGSELTVIALVLREKDAGPSVVATLFILGTLPLILFAPWAGLIADRFATRRVIPVAAVCQALLILSLVRETSIWVLFVTVFFASSFGSVVPPTWGALVPTLTTKEDLARVMAFNQSVFAMAGLAAPAVAGFLVATTGYVWPFIIDAITFMFIATVPFLLRVNRPGHKPEVGQKMSAFDGIRFIYSDGLLRSITILLATFILAAGVINVGIVFLLLDELGASAFIYGLNGSAFAAGALAGGVIASIVKVPRLKHPDMVVFSLCLMAVASMGIAFAWHWGVVLACALVAGFGNSGLQAFASGIIIGRSPDELRGRVMAGIGAVINVGSVGALGIGGVAIGIFGLREVLVTGAVVGVIALIVFGPGVIRQGHRVASAEAMTQGSEVESGRDAESLDEVTQS
jgi:MFS family permease